MMVKYKLLIASCDDTSYVDVTLRSDSVSVVAVSHCYAHAHALLCDHYMQTLTCKHLHAIIWKLVHFMI